MNEYSGWKVPTKDFLLPAFDLSDDRWPWNQRLPLSIESRQILLQQHIFEEYIRLRKPALLRASKNVHWISMTDVYDIGAHSTRNNALLRMLDMPQLEQWSSRDYASHLTKLAGAILVDVEVRSAPEESFGRGRLETMPFHRFLDRLTTRTEEGMYYLTASSKSLNTELLIHSNNERLSCRPGKRKRNLRVENSQKKENRHISIMSPLLEALNQQGTQFPLRPFIMGNLIPSSIHIWMGQSSSSSDNPHGYSSSGLHHDFHDNLYLLLRGSKHIRMYAPSDADRMYLQGRVAKVHGNGLINYYRDDVNGDQEETTPDGIPLSLYERYGMRLQRRELRDRRRREFEALDERRKEVERTIDLIYSVRDDSSVDIVDSNREDRFEEAESELEEILDKLVDWERESQIDDESDVESCHHPFESSDSDDEYLLRSHDTLGQNDAKATCQPKNFSKIPPGLLSNRAQQSELEQYPSFQTANEAQCELAAGEILYLPASWFHDVSSSSRTSDGDVGAHLALNFWYHPPSKLDGSWDDSPYASDYWPRNWRDDAINSRK